MTRATTSVGCYAHAQGPVEALSIPPEQLCALLIYVDKILKGAQARRPADPAAHEVRTAHQPQDRQDARSHHAAGASRARRRGDRISADFAAVRSVANGTSRRFAAKPELGRYRSGSGHTAWAARLGSKTLAESPLSGKARGNRRQRTGSRIVHPARSKVSAISSPRSGVSGSPPTSLSCNWRHSCARMTCFWN